VNLRDVSGQRRAARGFDDDGDGAVSDGLPDVRVSVGVLAA